MLPRVIGVLCVPAVLLAGLPVSALAAPPKGEDATADEDQDAPAHPVPPDDAEDPMTAAERLFDEGASLFETADFAGAIEKWTEAYTLVPNIPEYASIKAKLIANIATARERAHGVDGEVSHLNQAKILLESYREVIDVIYPDAGERDKELAWVAKQIAKIDAQLEALERDQPGPGPDQPEPRSEAPGRGLIIGGSVLTGLGAAGLGLMVAGMVIGGSNNDISDIPSNDLEARASRFAEGRLGNALAIAGGVGGGVLVVTGVALLVVGLGQKNAAGPGKTAVVPMLGPGQVGLGLVGRF